MYLFRSRFIFLSFFVIKKCAIFAYTGSKSISFSFLTERDDREDMQLNRGTVDDRVYILMLSEPCEKSVALKPSKQRTFHG